MIRESLLAYAKLNLSLAVRGRRPDGFHDIESIVQTVDLADEIQLAVGPGSAISVENSLPSLAGQDLAERAAAVLLARKRVDTRVEIRIQKAIPAGAGLGGGSSDAACILRALDRLVPPPLEEDDLEAIAATVGSDVAFFLVGGCARIAGRGETVTPLPRVRSETFMIVVPPIHCSTAEVYAAWDREGRAPLTPVGPGSNDLLPAALSAYPALRPWVHAIRGQGGLFSGMSGSGSAVYVAFATRSEAEARASRLRADLPPCSVFVCGATSSGSRSRTIARG